MTKREFIEQLHIRLSHLPAEEIEKSLSFYGDSIDDRIEDGMTEDAAVAALGDMDDIVQSIEVDRPLTALVKTKIRASREKSGNKRLWMVLAICGFPLWLPLSIAFAAVLFTFYLCIWVAVLCLYVALLSLAVAGVGGLLAGLLRGFVYTPAVGFFTVGAAICCAGLFLVCVHPINCLAKTIMGFTGRFIKWVKGLFISQKEVA